MKELMINPGTGSIKGATEKDAIENMRHFVTDCGVEDLDFVRIPQKDYGDGRYAFLIWRKNKCYEVQMPGLPLNDVRYVDGEKRSIFDFPRLYVDDSSWLWKFAIKHKEDFESGNINTVIYEPI